MWGAPISPRGHSAVCRPCKLRHARRDEMMSSAELATQATTTTCGRRSQRAGAGRSEAPRGTRASTNTGPGRGLDPRPAPRASSTANEVAHTVRCSFRSGRWAGVVLRERPGGVVSCACAPAPSASGCSSARAGEEQDRHCVHRAGRSDRRRGDRAVGGLPVGLTRLSGSRIGELADLLLADRGARLGEMYVNRVLIPRAKAGVSREARARLDRHPSRPRDDRRPALRGAS